VDTKRLALFIQIVDAGSINRAAAAAGLAQPALSQQLAILERELNVKLLNRSTRGVTATPAGEALYARARVILRQMESLRSGLQAGPQPVFGSVGVGVLHTHGLALGAPLLERCLTAYPQVRLCIVEAVGAALLNQLEDGLIDIAVAPVPVPHPKLESTPFMDEELLIVRAAGSGAPPGDTPGLASLRWIFSASQNMALSLLRGALARDGAEPNVVAEVNSLHVLLRAVQAGLGATLLPRAAIEEPLSRGALAAWPFPQGGLRRSVQLSIRREPPPTTAEVAVRALLEDIRLSR
jgi:LysR family transcriptional regulator, nitrogen assimilation regulatory protein